MKALKLTLISAAAATVLALGACSKKDETPTIGLITKTDTNPFFVKMKEGKRREVDDGCRRQRRRYGRSNHRH
jgi:fructose transport system substrate-binding protein